MKRHYRALLSPACSAVRRCFSVQLTALPRTQCTRRLSHRAVHTKACHTATSSTAASESADASASLSPLPSHPPSPPNRLSEPPSTTVLPSPTNLAAPADQFYTLGLDINTQTIGYVLLSPSLQTVRRGLITLSHLPPTSTPAARLNHVTEQLSAVLASLPPQALLHTAVESYLLSFTARRFQTRQLFQLAAFNSLVQCQLWHLTGRQQWPAVVNVNSARSRFGLKGEVAEDSKGRRVSDVKGVVWRWVDERLRRERDSAAVEGSASEAPGSTELEWRRKRDGSVHATMYDISDAYLIALTAALDRKQQPSAEAATATEQGRGHEEAESVEEDLTSKQAVTGKKPRVHKLRQASTVANTDITSNNQTRTKRRRHIVASE